MVRQSPQKFHTRTGAKFHSKSHGRVSSNNHRKSSTPELVQSFTAKAMVVCRQTITATVSHQNWCKVSQQKPWSCVVRQSPQTFHTRTGAKFYSKSHGRVSSNNHRKSSTPELVQRLTEKAMVACRQTITANVSHQNWCKVSQQKPWLCRQTITAKVSHQNCWCKVSQQKPWSYVVRQLPQTFHTRTGAKFHSKSHGRVSSNNHRKSSTPELVQSFTAKAMVVCRQTITANVSHQNWCKVSQQKPWSCVVRQSPQTFHTRTGAKFHSKSHGCVVRQLPQKFHNRTGAKFHSKSHGRMWSDNHRKSFTPELVQSFTAKAMVVCRQTITAKVPHQSWCKGSQKKPWSRVVRQSPQTFHTRTGAKFHSKSHGCVVRQSQQKFHSRTGAKFHSKSHGRMWSDNYRKSFTPELVQSFTVKAMVVCRQTITAKVPHQNWCKVSQQKPWSCVVRQSPQTFHTRTGAKFHSKSHGCVVRQLPQKFHTRTGAKFHSKSHGRVSSDNHSKSFTPELVQSFTAKAMVVCGQTITAKVSHQNWCKVSQQKPWSCVVKQLPQMFHTRTGAKIHSKSHGRVWSDNHRKSFTPELVQRFTENAMVVCRQTITAKVSHQHCWCKVSQQKPWSCVVRQSPQKFHTRTGAKFHSKSHGRMWSDNHRKIFTPEPVQSFTEKAMVVCRQTITAKVSHQNWCKVSQQRPWSCVVRQSPQKFHTRTDAKFHRKSHGRMWSDNHRKSFTPELLVQSFTAKAMVVRLEIIVVVVSPCRLSLRAIACNKCLFRTKYVKGLSTNGQS